MNKAYLLTDFGSTYTKLTLVDIDNEEIIATSKAITTVTENVMIGFNEAFKKLNYDSNAFQIVKKLACSSAAGGLKMITVGLVPELTAEAGKRAALGAGARVLKTYSYELTGAEIKAIKGMKVDIILLSGGTDGGNKKTIIENAKKIAEHFPDIPVIVAGNKCAYDEIEEIFAGKVKSYQLSDNVMPVLNEIRVDAVREKIRAVFMENIVKSKGMNEVENYMEGILMPTPAAVLKACEILSKGTDKQYGVGDLAVIDIGGATTDVHTLSEGLPSKAGINLKGLQEPFAKRTVEGDLGLRYSALSLFEACGTKFLKQYTDCDDIEEKCTMRHHHIEFVPETLEDIAFDEAMAKAATNLSMSRHAGHVEVSYTPLGDMYNQYGKDLTEMKYLIGTGGVVVHSKEPEKIMEAALFNPAEPAILKPKAPKILIDKLYILSAMGLLSFDLPDAALRIMKKTIFEL